MSAFFLQAQDSVYNLKTYSYKEMKTNWTTFSADAGWRAVNAGIKNKGYVLLDSSRTMWGAEGYIINPLSKAKEKVVYCAFDFHNKVNRSLASLVWIKRGDKTYKASIEFPAGVKNIDSSFVKSVEYFVNKDNKLQEAQSFGRCWRRAVRNNCMGYCAAFIPACGGIAAAFAVTGWGAVAIFLGCTTGGCASCFLLQAITCID